MKTLCEVLKMSTSYLEERGVPRARRLSEELLAHVLQMKRLDLYMQFDQPIEEGELASIRGPLKRLASGEPLEYVTNVVQFLDCEIEVDSRVLIPRSETEILVEFILKRMNGKVVWDICTGSGCIGIALKKANIDLDVTLSDLSNDALELAKRNSEKNGVLLHFKEGDLLEPFNGQKADVIVCNPPYVSTSEYLNLDPSVKDFEPRIALVGGESGIEFYERLSKDLSRYLNERAQVFLEIGAGQGELLEKIFSKGPWTKLELQKDYSGHDRFFFLEK